MQLKKIIASLLLTSTFALSQQIQIDLRHRPPEIILSNKHFSGPIVDIIEKLITAVNGEPQWLNVPWPRTLERAKRGTVDIVPRHSMTLDREFFLLPMLLGYEQRNLRYLLGPHIKNVEQYQSVEQLGKLSFGLLRGSFYRPHFEAISSRETTFFTNNIDQLVEMLLAGRIDVMPIQNLLWAEKAYAKIKDKYDNKRYQLAAVSDFFILGKYISIPKSSSLSHKYHQLNCLLFQWRHSGEIDAIYRQYKIQPYFQTFNNSESLKQATSCDYHQKQ